MAGLLFFILALAAGGYIIYKAKKANRSKATYKLPPNADALLLEHVAFYEALNAEQRTLFRSRMGNFLATTTITGIGTTVDVLDRLLIAAGAIIPIFAFDGWRYNNIAEVLLYADSFNKQYATEGDDERNMLGMVGDGAMNRQMILSKPSLHQSFDRAHDGHNTVIHEFVHLIDKADGATDGIPEYLLSKPYIMPWVKMIHTTIAEMRNNGANDINFYGATNDAEFLAVVSEYFFEKPDKLKEQHPELFAMLQQMFVPAAAK